jgi:hypothetical protein
MSGSSPHEHVQHERRTRWARRDASQHPLTEMEKAERRHHQARGQFNVLFWLAPVAFGALLDVPFGSFPQTALLTGGAVVASYLVALVLFIVAGAVLPYIGDRTVLVLHTAAMCLASGGLALLLLDVANGELLQVIPSLIATALLPLWPYAWRRVRGLRRTDYQKRLTESDAPPQGIIE